MRLTSETFQRPADLGDTTNPAVLYARSYLMTRTIVGLIGMALPLSLITAEVFMDGSARLRGSLSAYYHTSARDIFVGSLCVVGVLLMTYMSGQRNTKDFWLSLVAGAAAVAVALIPTARPDLPPTAPRCGIVPVPDGCTALQQRLGETAAAAAHFTAAVIFIVSLGILCFLFARRERIFDGYEGIARLLRACGLTIFASVVWVAVGEVTDATIFGLTPLYTGELISVWAFGVAWLVKGRDLWRRLVPGRHG